MAVLTAVLAPCNSSSKHRPTEFEQIWIKLITILSAAVMGLTVTTVIRPCNETMLESAELDRLPGCWSDVATTDIEPCVYELRGHFAGKLYVKN